MKKKIIFLDIDGVLNSWDYMITLPVGMESTEANQIDPALVQNLNKIVDKTSAQVVLSSTWRILCRLPEMRQILRSRGAKIDLIDKTPRLYGHRGQEIQKWLDDAKNLGIEVESFVILDDGNDMDHLSDRLVLIDPNIGLQDSDADKAIKLLS